MSPARAPFADLDDILLSTQHLLLSFDGTVCDLSSALQDISACDHLRNAITKRGFPLSADVIGTTDPLEVLSYAADADRDTVIHLESELTQLETRAAADAALTPHVHDVVNACRESGRSVTIISQNAIRAVKLYLNAHELARIAGNIVARKVADISKVRPTTQLVERAASDLSATPSSCALVCTTAETIEAAHISSAYSVAYARTSNDYDRLASAGAGAIITSLAHLALRLRARNSSGSSGDAR